MTFFDQYYVTKVTLFHYSIICQQVQLRFISKG